MSDKNPIMNGTVGTPLCWLMNNDSEPLLDISGRPLARFIVDFEYEYDEEGDDKCNIKFHFENLREFELPYIQSQFLLGISQM